MILPNDLYGDWVNDELDSSLDDWEREQEAQRQQEEADRQAAAQAEAEAFQEWEAEQQRQQEENAAAAAAAYQPPPPDAYQSPWTAWQNQVPTPSIYDARSQGVLTQPTQAMPYDWQQQQQAWEQYRDQQPIPEVWQPPEPPRPEPVVSTIDLSSREAFFRTAGPYARRIQEETGIPANIMLGIAVNEGALARGTVAAEYNNLFGIKASPGYAGPTSPVMNAWEVRGGRNVTEPSRFRAYASPEESFRDFARFLHENPRYAGALQQTGDPEAFIRAVHRAGYATDPNWSNQVLAIARQVPAPPPPALPEEGNYVEYQGYRYPVTAEIGGYSGTPERIDEETPPQGIAEPPPLPEPEPEPEPQPQQWPDILGPPGPQQWDDILGPPGPQQFPEVLGPEPPPDYVPPVPEQREIQERGAIPAVNEPGTVGNPDLVPNQFGASLSAEAAAAACGPAAAVAFARQMGRNPTLEEALALAKDVGWTAGGGMNGIQNQARLLDAMNIPNRWIRTGERPDEAPIIRDIQGGNPVTISSGGHYFVADAYQGGRYHVGTSGTVVSRYGGSAWMTMAEMNEASRRLTQPRPSGINGLLFLDNPATPTPSIASLGDTSENRPVQTGADTRAALQGLQLPGRETAAPQVPEDEEALYQQWADEAIAELQAPQQPPSLVEQAGRTLGGAAQAIGETVGNAAWALGDIPTTAGLLNRAGVEQIPYSNLRDVANQVYPVGGVIRAGEAEEVVANETRVPWEALQQAIADYGYEDARTLQAALVYNQAAERARGTDTGFAAAERHPAFGAGELVAGGITAAASTAIAPSAAAGLARNLAALPLDPTNIIGLAPEAAMAGVRGLGALGRAATRGLGDLGPAAAPLRTADEFLSGQPGSYRGFRAAVPGELGSERQAGATFIAQDRDFADILMPGFRGEADNARVMHEVTVDVQRPFVMEGQNVDDFAQVMTEEWHQMSGKPPPTPEQVTAAADYFRRSGIQEILPETRARLLEQGYDAIVDNGDLGGEFGPVLIALRPDRVQMQPLGATGLPAGGAQQFENVAETLSGANRPFRSGLGPTPPEEVPEFAGNILLRKYPEEIQQQILRAYDANPQLFEEARRGVIPDQVVRDLATYSGIDTDTIVKRWKPGTAVNAETALALREAMASQANVVLDAQQAFRNAAPGATGPMQALGEELLRYRGLQEVVAGVTAEAGRALRQFRQPITGTAPISAAAQRLDELMRMAQKAGKMDEFEELLRTTDLTDPAKVAGLARSLFGPSPKDYWNWYIYFNMLTSPVGRIRDTVSNGLALAGSIVEPAFAAPYAGLGAAVKGVPRERYVREVPERLAGAIMALPDASKHALQMLKQGFTEGEVVGAELGAMVREPVRIPGKYGPVEIPDELRGLVPNVHTRVIRANDAFYSSLQRNAELYGQAYRQARIEGKSGQELADRVVEIRAAPTEKMLEDITAAGRYHTFQQGGAFVDWAAAGKEKLTLGGVPVARLFVPFHQTPYNLAKYSLERSPLAVFALPKKVWDVAHGTMTTGEFADYMGRMSIGTGIALGVWQLAQQDLLTGAVPRDESDRDAFYRQGKQPYSMNVGGEWRSYQWAQPFSTILAAMATASDLQKKGQLDQAQDLVGIWLLGTARALVDQPFTQGLADVLELLEKPAEQWGPAFANYLKKTVPGTLLPASAFLRFLARASDQVIREPGEGMVQPVVEGVLASIPGLTGMVPAKLNAFGQEVLRPVGQLGLGALDITRPSEPTRDPVEIELAKLQQWADANHVRGPQPGFPSPSLPAGSEPSRMSREQYRALEQHSGPLVAAWLASQLGTPEWERLGPEARIKRINDMMTARRAEARLNMELPTVRPPGQPWRYQDQRSGRVVESLDLERQLARLDAKYQARMPLTPAEEKLRDDYGETERYKDWAADRRQENREGLRERQDLRQTPVPGRPMTRYEPHVWGEHLNPTERVMVDELIRHFRKRSEETAAVEVRRTTDGQYRLYAIRRQVLDPQHRRVEV